MLENGNLFSMGEDLVGATGTRKNRCVIDENYVEIPKPISRWNMKDEKVLDFDMGQDSLIILLGLLPLISLDNGRVLYTGLNKIYQPTEINIPSHVKPVKIAAGFATVAVLGG